MDAMAGKARIVECMDRSGPERGVAASAGESPGAMWLLPALLAGIVLFAVAHSAHAGLYKWTDEHGIVHYSDRLPPDAVNRASSQLNREGITVRKTGEAPTAAEQQARRAQEAQKRDIDRERMLAERRDRALIDSYTNEGDIDLAKSRALATIEGQIASARSYVAQIVKRRDQLQAQKSGQPGRAVPPAIGSELAQIDGELARQADFIAAKQKEAAAVASRYDADKRRFHDLKRSASEAPGSGTATRLSAADSAPGAAAHF